jgi:hypothetical protein
MKLFRKNTQQEEMNRIIKLLHTELESVYAMLRESEKSNVPVVNHPNLQLDRHTKPWAMFEDKRLIELKKKGMNNTAIARDLKRTTGSVEQRLIGLRKAGKL